MDLYFTQIDPPDHTIITGLMRKGWTCRHLPFRKVTARPFDRDPGSYEILLITSKHAARRLLAQHLPTLPKLAVVGRATSDLLPPENLLFPDAPVNADELATRLSAKVPKQTSLLFVRGAKAKSTLADALGADYRFDETIVYQTTEIPQKGEAPTPGSMVYFQAPSTVSDYRAHFQHQPDFVAVIGASTAKAVQSLGWSIHFQPDRPENRHFMDALPSAAQFLERKCHS